jgi:hypothetical protein
MIEKLGVCFGERIIESQIKLGGTPLLSQTVRKDPIIGIELVVNSSFVWRDPFTNQLEITRTDYFNGLPIRSKTEKTYL